MQTFPSPTVGEQIALDLIIPSISGRQYVETVRKNTMHRRNAASQKM